MKGCADQSCTTCTKLADARNKNWKHGKHCPNRVARSKPCKTNEADKTPVAGCSTGKQSEDRNPGGGKHAEGGSPESVETGKDKQGPSGKAGEKQGSAVTDRLQQQKDKMERWIQEKNKGLYAFAVLNLVVTLSS